MLAQECAGHHRCCITTSWVPESDVCLAAGDTGWTAAFIPVTGVQDILSETPARPGIVPGALKEIL